MEGVNNALATEKPMIELTVGIVAAYIQKNAVPVSTLPDLIAIVNSALSNIGQPSPISEPAPKPAVNPKRSVFRDYIISLEDGKKYKSLKRHLATSHGLTPDEYRAKWGLAKNYPMVAPSYSATQSALAKSLGLGRKPASTKKLATKRKAKA
ncbi:MucR family transcriptional regulator [Mesorhizobium sp. VK23B]|uniref:MucR family transcriptional regulator n=2 Tax=Mesorhizobium dulcispinae TaxID=3072316 RepID=A0ABU4XN39_9HYPH|nr:MULTISPECIES: MucR family transcriptional regulator [unclassified Mesorhizobium]MDX8469072.1 MucR family transcriptional regulator [Mesorhizobium sp. VK23B]MDX8475388.1 MucR family transcriptional regulator [Mesorhizobium sp. VK23A]